jgi:formylmethanofuran dehydrogenase subunit E
MMERETVTLDLEGAQRFHGHMCPGLAIGIRVSEVALREIGPHAADEEVIAIVETDMCAVDAIQYFTGCTFGKGNLLHRDYGKSAFTFIRRSDGKAIRISVRPHLWDAPDPEREAVLERVRQGEGSAADRQKAEAYRKARMRRILEGPIDELFEVRAVEPEVPEHAYLYESVHCAGCGERVMETRVRLLQGAPYCIPCFQARDRQVGGDA